MTEDNIFMKTFFKWVWQFRPIFCECGCGKKIPKEINTACMDHLLEKAKYEECKYSKSNIFFCHPDCHADKTIGHPHVKHLEKIEWAKENIEKLQEESRKFEVKIKQLIYGESRNEET